MLPNISSVNQHCGICLSMQRKSVSWYMYSILREIVKKESSPAHAKVYTASKRNVMPILTAFTYQTVLKLS